VSGRATEWSFQFENPGPTSTAEAPCELLIMFPPRLGGARQRARLTGSWSALVEPDGTMLVTGLSARLSSFPFPLPDPKSQELHWRDTGQLTATLGTPPSDPTLARKLPRPNTGRIDPKTGITQITWGFWVHSLELAALDIDPVPVLLTETGFQQKDTGTLVLAGGGIVTAGVFRAVLLINAKVAAPKPTLTVSVPDVLLQLPRTNTVTVTYTMPTPPPAGAAAISFNLTGTNTGNPPGTVSITTPVTIPAAGGTARATLTVTGSASNANLIVDVQGGGLSASGRGRVQ
jgi:hypothetical protein